MDNRKEATASPNPQGRLWIWAARHKKKLGIILLCAVLLLAAALVIYTRPRPLINPSGPYLCEPEIYHVELGGEDITDQVDLDALMGILQNATYRRAVFPGRNVYQSSSDLIEMTVRTGYRYELVSMIMYPDRQCACDFTPRGAWWHPISDGEAIYDALLAAVEA